MSDGWVDDSFIRHLVGMRTADGIVCLETLLINEADTPAARMAAEAAANQSAPPVPGVWHDLIGFPALVRVAALRKYNEPVQKSP